MPFTTGLYLYSMWCTSVTAAFSKTGTHVGSVEVVVAAFAAASEGDRGGHHSGGDEAEDDLAHAVCLFLGASLVSARKLRAI